MVERISPCNECRKRRRKCIRSSAYDICSRCKRLDRECIDGSDEEHGCSEINGELPLLQQQVDELSFLLEKMESQVYTLSQTNNSDCKSCNNDYLENDFNKQLTQRDTLYVNSNKDISSIVNNNNKLWKLTFHNGTLRIETGIRSISDLLMQSLSIPYLSPFHSSPSSSTNEDSMTIQFNPGNTISFMPLTIKLMTKCITSLDNSTSFLLPTSFDIHSIIEESLYIYFQCKNKHKPLIHEETFMQHYHEVESPLDSLICLSICCSVCVSPCDHSSNDPYKSRQLADFFYDLAKTKLMNQFDEPSKRLENLISINLLQDYMLLVMKIEDYKTFMTIGYHICWDLQSWFDSTKEQGNTIERTLYSRHFLMIFFSQGLLSLITSGPINYLTMAPPELLLMDDEPKETADFVYAQNYMIKLYNHPYLTNIKLQIHYRLLGDPFSLKFESIIRMEDIFKEWWKSVPSKYRICDSWWDLNASKAAIDRCENEDQLILYNHFIAFMIDVYSALLQPSPSETSNDQAFSVVQELSLRKSLDYCQIIIYSQIRSLLLDNGQACHTIMISSGYLFHTFDALITLASSKNDSVQATAKEILAQTRDILKYKKILENHRVETYYSPLLASARKNDINSIRISEYLNYPQPWLAIVYDLIHHLDKVQTTNGVLSIVE